MTVSRRNMKPAHNRLYLVGQKFGRLKVVGFAGVKIHPSGSSHSLWGCVCDCGGSAVCHGTSLISGNSKSCGCLTKEARINRATHRKTNTRVHRIWQAMLNRCRNSNTAQYHNYGGRGIKVCDRWTKFENFYADMGEPPEGHSIERNDNDGNYCPENCCWADRNTQARNKSTNRIIEFNGVSKVLKDWAADLGIDQASLRERLDKWPLEKALTQPRTR